MSSRGRAFRRYVRECYIKRRLNILKSWSKFGNWLEGQIPGKLGKHNLTCGCSRCKASHIYDQKARDRDKAKEEKFLDESQDLD